MAKIQTHLTWRQRLARYLLDPVQFEQALQEEIKEEAELLNRDILVRELQLIDDQHRIMAARAKQVFLGNWLLQDANSSSGTEA